MCWAALCSTEDLDTIEREIGLRVERQLIERFLHYGGVMVLDVQYRFLFPAGG